MKIRQFKQSAKKGFTLIELAIVGIFLGLLALFAIAMFGSNATTATKAKGLYEAATKTADNWAVLSQSCGLTSNVKETDLTGGNDTTGANNLSLLLGTSAKPVAKAYEACYAASGIRPLSGTSKGAPGEETVYEFPMTVSASSASGSMGISYANVAPEVALAMYQAYSSAPKASIATTMPPTADDTDPQLRFSAPVDGKYTVTIMRAL